jgi:phosphatidylserine/phosphatidylglycerophosphate/cardiolipin synthase-like enzyme
MRDRKLPLILGLVVLAMACSFMPSGRADAPPISSTETAAAPPPLTVAPSVVGPEPIAPIDLHVGRGVRGPWFELYFTDPTDPAGSQYSGGVDERLVEAVDAARLSVHMAIYNLNLNTVREALIRAHRRGLDVRVVTESDNQEGDDLQRLIAAGVPVLGDRRDGIMHNKFTVIDGSQVWTGSMNYTGSGVYADNNCLIRIFSSELAQAYEAEFSEMFEDDNFGPQGGSSEPFPTLVIDGTPLEVRFAPDDRPEPALVNLVDTARESVDFLAFSFTSDPLGEALMRADRDGVQVRGVMDEEQATSNTGSELPAFHSAGLDVRLDGNPGQMHSKVLIIDQEIVVFGSYNFSRSANETNDENILVIHNQAIARRFQEEFARIYAAALP